MSFNPEDFVKQIPALRAAAEKSWGQDTRHPGMKCCPEISLGQCYVTSAWLAKRLGGAIGHVKGHYFWISPDHQYGLDLVGDNYVKAPHTTDTFTQDEEDEGFELHEDDKRWHPGPYVFKTLGNPVFHGYEVVKNVENERTRRFAKRADAVLDHKYKIALDYAGDAFPAEEPEALNEERKLYKHDFPEANPESNTYNFVYANGALHVSADHDHDTLKSHAGIDALHNGPEAKGEVTVFEGKARWKIEANLSIAPLIKILKEASQNYGWTWGGAETVAGHTFDQHEPKTSTRYFFADHEEEFFISDHFANIPGDSMFGILEVVNDEAYVVYASSPITDKVVGILEDFTDDKGFRTRNLEDLELFNNSNPHPWKEDEGHYFTDQPEINQENEKTPRKLPKTLPFIDGGFPELDPDATHPPRVTEMWEYRPASSPVLEQIDGWVRHGNSDAVVICKRDFGFLHSGVVVQNRQFLYAHGPEVDKIIKYASKHITEANPVDNFTLRATANNIKQQIPFVYDIKEDKLYVGHPGERHSEMQIPGKFTPGGMVEGTYNENGKVQIRSMTSWPYSVQHLLQLWQYQAKLPVKSMELLDDIGNTTKLASQEVDGIFPLIAANPAASKAYQAMESNGGHVYAVGGAVRDLVMGKSPNDIDLMVTELPKEQLEAALDALPGRVDLTGKSFGVYRYRHGGDEVEIALPRKETSTGDSHKDFEVDANHNYTVVDDLHRRDFRANAMAIDLRNRKLVDPFNGKRDIEEGTLSLVNPQALKEDPLRILRAFAAMSRFGLMPDQDLKNSLTNTAASLVNEPKERVQKELDKIIAGDNGANAVRLAHETGVLKHILPEVDDAFGYDQNNPHHEKELGDHLLSVFERVGEKTNDKDVRLAALLHDIGKPASAWIDPETGSSHYYKKILDDGTQLGDDHETVGADMARERLKELKYPNARIDRISHLIQHHMYNPFRTEKGARRHINRVGDEHVDDLFNLRWADQGGKSDYPNDPSKQNSLDNEMALVQSVRQNSGPTGIADLAINGNDLIQLGLKPGPEFKAILQSLSEAVMDDPSLNNRQTLLRMALGG